MKPFRSKGWKYLSKFESIIPIAGANGKRAFAASTAVSSSRMPVATESSDEENEEELLYGGVTPAAIGKASESESVADNMDIDQIDDGNATIWQKSSTSSGKCKLDHWIGKNDSFPQVNANSITSSVTMLCHTSPVPLLSLPAAAL